jgi:hypothetical protein
MILSRRMALLMAPSLILICAEGVAQTPAQDSASAPRLQLSVAQMQAIYQSITKTQKNDAAPTGFRVAVGATVPESVTLMPMPTSVAELIPQTKGLEVARVEGEVILVDPRSKQVLSVVTPEP